MEEIIYALAAPGDLAAVKFLLGQSQLHDEDITAAHLENFVVAKNAGELIGVIGVEACGRAGLLRSLAVAPAWRKRGIARELYERLLARAHLLGLTEFYLLTQTAAGFFARLGFAETLREAAPAAIQGTREFHSL